MRCECGKQYEQGAMQCPRCGKPLQGELNMRYDGAVIRSKTKKRTLFDKIWALFANVKFGVTLIVLTLLFAALGTILPQVLFVDTSRYSSELEAYKHTYGTFGALYYRIGLADIYNATAFQALVLMLAASIIVASIDRGVPLFKALYNQRVKKHPNFMKRQRFTTEVPQQTLSLAQLQTALQQKRYNVKIEDGALLAEKGCFARFGPYINHLGLIIFLAGVMLRVVPGFYVDEEMWVREGDTTSIPGAAGYYVKNNDFILETYDGKRAEDAVNETAKKYETKATIYHESSALPGDTSSLQKLKDVSIEVNHPAKFDGYQLYQMDYRLDELKTMTFALTNKKTGQAIDTLTIDLANPKKEYVLKNGAKVKLAGYYPDFSGFDDDGEPMTQSPNPSNPAFLFDMYTKETPKGETSFVQIQKTMEPLGETQYKMVFKNATTRDITGLKVRKDVTMPILFTGAAIFMLGLIIGSYFSHRRVWCQQLDDRWLIAAHTNKNAFAFKKELRAVTDDLTIAPFNDAQEEVIADATVE